MLGTLAEDGNLQLQAATGECRYRVSLDQEWPVGAGGKFTAELKGLEGPGIFREVARCQCHPVSRMENHPSNL